MLRKGVFIIMEYIYKINGADLLRLKKKEANVLFLRIDGEIEKNSVLYLYSSGKVVGQCTISSVLAMDVDELRNIETRESKVIDMRRGIDVNDYCAENEFFQYLMKGYEVWKKNTGETDFGKYLIYIGYGTDKDKIMAQKNTWNRALMIDNLDVFEKEVSLSYFSDVKRAREKYRNEIVQCNKHGYFCVTCPYLGACLNENVNLRSFALREMPEDFMECMFIHPTVSGLRNTMKTERDNA